VFKFLKLERPTLESVTLTYSTFRTIAQPLLFYNLVMAIPDKDPSKLIDFAHRAEERLRFYAKPSVAAHVELFYLQIEDTIPSLSSASSSVSSLSDTQVSSPENTGVDQLVDEAIRLVTLLPQIETVRLDNIVLTQQHIKDLSTILKESIPVLIFEDCRYSSEIPTAPRIPVRSLIVDGQLAKPDSHVLKDILSCESLRELTIQYSNFKSTVMSLCEYPRCIGGLVSLTLRQSGIDRWNIPVEGLDELLLNAKALEDFTVMDFNSTWDALRSAKLPSDAIPNLRALSFLVEGIRYFSEHPSIVKLDLRADILPPPDDHYLLEIRANRALFSRVRKLEISCEMSTGNIELCKSIKEVCKLLQSLTISTRHIQVH
jgi:hypothetical protein